VNDHPACRTALFASGAALITVILWASAFVAIRQVRHDFGPGALALGRLIVGSLVLGVVVVGRRLPTPGRRPYVQVVPASAGVSPTSPSVAAWSPQTAPRSAGVEAAGGSAAPMSRQQTWVRLVLIGVLWFGVYNVALNAAERRVDAGTASMLVNVGPILIAALAAVVLREGFSGQLAVGIAIAFAGVVVIGLATSDGGGADMWGVVGCLVAAIAYAVAVVTQKPLLQAKSALTVTWIGCTIGVLVCVPYAPELIRELGTAHAGNIWWIVYLGAFPTALAFTTWAYALARTSAGRLGVSTYAVPPIAILLGWWLLGEAPAALAYLGGVLCLVGVYVSRRKPRSARPLDERAGDRTSEPAQRVRAPG
jgi:drug/metabolite transporter (DMT)-like permease